MQIGDKLATEIASGFLFGGIIGWDVLGNDASSDASNNQMS